jgi:hypothetical protein
MCARGMNSPCDAWIICRSSVGHQWRLSKRFGNSQAAAYGKCVSQKLSNIRKDECAAEFKALKTCMEGAVCVKSELVPNKMLT